MAEQEIAHYYKFSEHTGKQVPCLIDSPLRDAYREASDIYWNDRTAKKHDNARGLFNACRHETLNKLKRDEAIREINKITNLKESG